MKIIFLDIDGVLASMDYLRVCHMLKEKNPDKYGYAFDIRCVKNLEYILKKCPDVKIVISSSWKTMGYENILKMWKLRNLPGNVIGTTPDLLRTAKPSSRGDEIKEWLSSVDDVKSYVIIDDDSDMLKEQLDNFIQTDSEFGLTLKDSIKAIKILNRV